MPVEKNRSKGMGYLSGFVQVWKLWRHCCCRYGFSPLIVAPIVTASCLLDLYSSYDCEFITVEIGFTPSNPSWNHSKATLGLFQYQSGFVEDSKDILSLEVLTEGCRIYPEDFESVFIEGDRTWQVGRIMSFISGGSSIIAALTAWLMVILPLPACFFWPGVLLPSLLVAFLCQGSKFLFLDTAICQSSLWFPTGTESLPQRARSCSLGKTSYFSIAAGISLFLSLFLVCLTSPRKRKLNEDYGNLSSAMGIVENTSLEEDHAQDCNINKCSRRPTKSISTMEKQVEQDLSSFDDEASLFDSTGDRHRDLFAENNSKCISESNDKDVEQGSVVIGKDLSSFPNKGPLKPCKANNDDSVSVEAQHENGTKYKHVEENLSHNSETNSKAVTSAIIISQARLSKAELMQSKSYSNTDLIDKCVMELTKSFQTEPHVTKVDDI